jgi:hypothetical protein
MFDSSLPIPDRVRAACAWVAAEAELVRIEESAIEEYAMGLPAAADLGDPDPRMQLLEGDRESLAAFAICLNAINFGSGWWPTIRKPPGLSGYSTIAAGVTERFRAGGAWTPKELTRIHAADVAEVVGQDADHPLMPEFATALRDVGVRVLAEHGGRFEAVVEAGGGSAVHLATLLASWEAFADTSLYRERQVPFFKRAQLAAADLDRAGVAAFPDRDQLTAFADNLVPHVLRLDGVLILDQDLKDGIEAGELLPHGSAGEVELRACTVHAVELLAAATAGRLSPAEIDVALWNRGREPRYKAIPRPRSRNTAY